MFSAQLRIALAYPYSRAHGRLEHYDFNDLRPFEGNIHKRVSISRSFTVAGIFYFGVGPHLGFISSIIFFRANGVTT